MAVQAPPQLPKLVREAFAAARVSGEVHYFPTKVTMLSVGAIPFQLRFSPALANKPGRAEAKAAQEEARPDPFAYPPRSLLVADLGPSHYVVLNKFAVVAEHFIVATRAFRPQTHLLDEADLAATLACVRAYADAGAELFAFFNGGDDSGASQPHRHIQFVPVASMRDGLEEAGGDVGARQWSVLVTSARHRDAAPFALFSEPVDATTTPRHLHAAYLRLYRAACRAAMGDVGADDDDDAARGGEARISYNLALTADRLVVCPRRAEGASLGDDNGRLALNGTVLAGTALVKTQREWELLRRRPDLLERVLRCIGVPRGEPGS